MNEMKLKSGTDVRGTAMGPSPLMTTDIARRLGYVFARMTAHRAGKTPAEVTLAIGRDSRITGPARQQRKGLP